MIVSNQEKSFGGIDRISSWEHGGSPALLWAATTNDTPSGYVSGDASTDIPSKLSVCRIELAQHSSTHVSVSLYSERSEKPAAGCCIMHAANHGGGSAAVVIESTSALTHDQEARVFIFDCHARVRGGCNSQLTKAPRLYEI